MNPTKLLRLTTLVLATGLWPHVQAAPPRLLPFQGRLTDANGTPVADGAKVVQFKIYDAPTGGTAVWAGEVQKLTVNGGLVSTLLGSKASLDAVDFNRALYLEITVDANSDNQITAADPPLLPRQSILPAVYAVEATAMSIVDGNGKRVGGAGWSALVSNAANPDTSTWRIDGGKLLNQSVTQAQIANSAIGTTQLALGAVNQAQIANLAVGTAQLSNQAVANAQLATDAVTTAKIKDGEVQRQDLADGSVTFEKLGPRGSGNGTASLGQMSVLSVSQTFSTANTSINVGSAPTQITISGKRPVMVGLVPDTNSDENIPARFEANSEGSFGCSMIVRGGRDGTTSLGASYIRTQDALNVSNRQVVIPPSSFWFLDLAPAAGGHNYQLQVYSDYPVPGFKIVRSRLIAFEL